jgi:hypothetical protein
MEAVPVENISLRLRTHLKLPELEERATLIENLVRDLNELANFNGKALGYFSLAIHRDACRPNPKIMGFNQETDEEDIRLAEELHKPTRGAGGFYGDHEIELGFTGYVCPATLKIELINRKYKIISEGKRKSCYDLQRTANAENVSQIDKRGGIVSSEYAEKERMLIKTRAELENLKPKTSPESMGLRRKEKSGELQGIELTKARCDLALKQAGWL